jgi:hypothetical protein
MPLNAIQKMLRHKKVTTTAIYLQIDDERVQQEVARIDRYNEAQERLAAQKEQPFVHDSSAEPTAEAEPPPAPVH